MYTPRVSDPKGTPDKATLTLEMKQAEAEGKRVVGFFPLTASLFEENVIDNKEEMGEKERERRGRHSEVFTTDP